MAVLMFWNVGRRNNAEAIGRLCGEQDVDILLLAEADIGSARLVTEINDAMGSTRTLWELPHRESRVRAFTRYAPGFVKPAFDDGQVEDAGAQAAYRPTTADRGHAPTEQALGAR
jgi:hypothetical protein